jgi:GYF domain 2
MYRIIGGDGNEYGPVSAEQVRDWIKQGRASAQTKIRPEAGGEWRTIGELPEFASAPGTPAAPPLAGTGTVQLDIDALAAETLARQPKIQIGACFSRGWRLVTERFWLSVGVVLVGMLVQQVPLIVGVMQAGLMWFFLKRARGEEVRFEDAFAGFSVAFLPTFLAGIVMVLLLLVGFALCVIPGLVFAVLWSFTWLLLMDKRLDFWPAMELSRKVLWPNFWGMFGLLFVSMLVIILGLLCCYVGVLVAMPVVLAAHACAYDDFFPRRSSETPPTAPSIHPPAPAVS